MIHGRGLPGNRPHNVAVGPHHRCSFSGGSTPSQGEVGPVSHIAGAVGRRPRRLADSLLAESCRRPSFVDIPGQDQHPQPVRQAICQPGPVGLVAVVLAYVKELEVLTSKKGEATSPKKASNPKADPEANPSPKRKTRFPRRVKQDAEQQGQ